MCKVSWCNDYSRKWKNGKPMSLCSTHVQYKNICINAININRPHLMYKVEMFAQGKHQCEQCNFDPVVAYPNLHLRAQASLLDVDHINSNIKHTVEGEHPDNYQLLCKHCHIVKSHLEGDYIAKVNRK